MTPAPTYTPDHPLQLLVTNLSANEYVGRMAVGRVWNGTIRVGQRIVVVRDEPDDTAGTVEPGRVVTLSGTVTSLQTARGIERIDIGAECHQPLLAAMGVVFPAEGDLAIGKVHDAGGWRWRRDACSGPDSGGHVRVRRRAAWRRPPSLDETAAAGKRGNVFCSRKRLQLAGQTQLPATKARFRPATNLPRKTRLSTFTGRKNG